MRFLKSADEPTRLHKAADPARAAVGAAVGAAAEQASRARRWVGLAGAACALGAIVWAVRAARTRTVAGEDATADAIGLGRGSHAHRDGHHPLHAMTVRRGGT